MIAIGVPVRGPRDLDDAFALMARQRVPGIGSVEYAEGGGLLTYTVDFTALWRRAPYFVDRILKGACPATIPVERAATFALTVNLGAARALGVARSSTGPTRSFRNGAR